MSPETEAISSKFCGLSVLEWLLEPENPSVRFLALTELLGRSRRSVEVREARAAIMQSGVVPAILDLQKPEGYWLKPDQFYTAKYRGTVWQLIVLAEHCAVGTDARIRRACEFILEYSQDHSSGGFSQKRAMQTGGGIASEVIPCLTGNLVWSLLRLGHANDSRIDRGIEWLTQYLRFDDGESVPPADWPYERWEMCYGRHTCFMGVVKGIKALAEIPAKQRSTGVKRTIETGCDFLLHHRVFKRSHNPARIAIPGFIHFGFPRMYQTDVLEIMLILLSLGIRDQRMQEALHLIESKRGPDGRWRMEDSFNGKFQVDIEERDAPSKWITLNALRVLKLAGGAVDQ